MEDPAAYHWSGKSAEDLLAEFLHHIRNPIYVTAGSLSVLKAEDQLSPEQVQQVIDLAFRSAVRAREVVESLSQYLFETRKGAE